MEVTARIHIICMRQVDVVLPLKTRRPATITELITHA